MSDHLMNIASLSVSAVALVAIFETCLRGCDFVSRAKTTSESCQKYLSQVDFERRRLAIWGRKWGLIGQELNQVEHDLNIADTRQIIHDALTSIEGIVCDFDELRQKYGLDITMLSAAGGSDTLPDTFQGDPLHNAALRNSHQSWQDRISKRQEELSWLSKVSYSFADESKLCKLAAELSWYVTRLWELLMSEKLLGIERCLTSEVLSTATNEGRLRLVRSATTTDGVNSAMANHVDNQLLAHNLERQATGLQPGLYRCERKHNHALVRMKSASREERCIADFIEETTGFGRGQVHRPVAVLIEWKKGNWPPSIGAEMEKRVDNLALILGRVKSSIEGENYRVLECVGYFEDPRPNTFGLIYRLPKSANPIEEPISLYQLMGTGNQDLKRMPSLDCRIRLALRLAISLHEFHSSGWLHKRITSDNIIFFRQEGQSLLTEDSLLQPYLVGFGVSRPSNDPRGTEEKSTSTGASSESVDLYRHPSQKTASSKRQHDIYSLGLVLLEIARWSRLETIIEDRGDDPGSFHENAVSYAEDIDFDVGKSYCEVVKTLLRNLEESFWTKPRSLYSQNPQPFDEPPPDSSTDVEAEQGKILRDFYYAAIAKLESISLG